MGLARRLGYVLIVAALSGCALKSPPERAEVAKQALPNVQVPAAWTSQGGAAGVIADK